MTKTEQIIARINKRRKEMEAGDKAFAAFLQADKEWHEKFDLENKANAIRQAEVSAKLDWSKEAIAQ